MDGLQREKSFSFIGYSRNKNFDTEEFKKNIGDIIDALYDKGYRTLMVSPFSFVESIVTEELIKKKNALPDIRLIVLKNGNADRSSFYGACDELIDIEECEDTVTDDVRNCNYEYLIDNTSILVCYMDSKPKRRALSLEKAIARNMEIINVFSKMKQ